MITPHPELLAPAGGPAELDAALKAGADAVYFGLKKLNARVGAKNFAPEALEAVVKTIHDAHAKAYLTLNIDIAQRELGLAVRTLALAEQCGVDAVLVRDAALLCFIPAFPRLEFHFSTQAAISSSAGVEAAKQLGIKRTVLARELSESEIKACTAVPGMEIEVFVQGALCFSCSGRCLLSSWVGGRSGNRGACASPCRVRWTNASGATSTPLSMHDMCLADELARLQEINVASFKIEGRLKSAPWVSRTVQLYREALNGSLTPEALAQSTEKLGAYAGRQMSNSYFHGVRANVTGESARPTGTCEALPDCQAPAPTVSSRVTISSDDANGTLWHLEYNSAETTLRTPPQRIANARRAISTGEIAEELARMLAVDKQPAEIANDNPVKLLPRNAGNRVIDEAMAFIRKSAKETDGVVRDIVLPQAARDILEAPHVKCPSNCLHLGDKPNLLRVTVPQAHILLDNRDNMLNGRKLIVEITPQQNTDEISMLAQDKSIHSIALPSVIYEGDIPLINTLLEKLSPHAIIEVNSWDTWQLAKASRKKLTAGPGMAILNALAARQLAVLGCQSATISCEIDSDQLQALCASAETPLSLTVFSYPALMSTRAELPRDFGPGTILSDGREISLRPQREGSVTVMRSIVPMDWRKLQNPKVLVTNLIIDLTGAASLDDIPEKSSLFNYDRRLR